MGAEKKHIAAKPASNENLESELQAKKLQLHWLLQITKAINYNFSTKQLLDVYEHVLISQLKVDRLALFIKEDVWNCRILIGTDKTFENIDLKKILKELNELHNPETDKQLWVNNFDYIIPVTHKEQMLAYAFIGGYENSPIRKKNELTTFIQTITNLITVAAENNTTAAERIRQAAIKRELELAAQMQSMLFPEMLPDDNSVEFYASYLPHQEVGGDYYDFIKIDDKEFVFCMADVSGKGIPAALLMSNFQANLHAHLDTTGSLDELVRVLNTKVFQNAKAEKFITFFIGRYNTISKELHYINAGHNPPFLIHDKVVYLLNEGTTGLGMFNELPFVNTGKLFIPENAVLHCYTDGVTDTENEEDQDYGVERLKHFFVANHSLVSLPELHRLLIQNLNAYRHTRNFTDDITLLSCRFKPSSPKK